VAHRSGGAGMGELTELIFDPDQPELFPEAARRYAQDVGSGYAREGDDYYVEPEWLVHALIDKLKFPGGIHDPSCGSGTIPRVFNSRRIAASGSELRDRGYGETGVDFLLDQRRRPNIVSNPPFGILLPWIDHALSVADGRVCVVARLAFLESQGRKQWFETRPIEWVLVSCRRASMPPGDSTLKAAGGKVPYAWFVFNAKWKKAPRLGWL
jgi:hypothetical protein